MRSVRLWLILGLLVLGACGDGGSADSTTPPEVTTSSSSAATTTTAGTTTTIPSGFIVTSEDGAVTVEVGPDAIDVDPGITVDLLAPEDYPPELAAAATNPSVRIYELGPAGLQFDAPVRVTRTIEIDQFGLVSDTAIPVVYLMTRTEDGAYEVYDDLRVRRVGDVVEVSGTTTHFSPLVGVNGQVQAEINPGPGHSVFATEVGLGNAFAGVTFRGADGTELNAPPFEWVTDEDFANFCASVGRVDVGFGVTATLAATPDPGQAGLVGPNALAPGIESVDIVLEAQVAVDCLDPDTSLVGTMYSFDAKVDHPGGAAIVPNEDFRGGLSALAGSLTDTGRFDGAWIGLIEDLNGNGIIDLNDEFLRMRQMERSGSGGVPVDGVFVSPLYGYGGYFVYVIDALSFGDLSTWGNSPMSIADAVVALAGLFVGEGRPETAIGVLGDLGIPLGILVGPPESSHVAEDSVLPLLEDWQVIYGWR